MTDSVQTCPICKNLIKKSTIDSTNLSFLQVMARDGKLDATISLARIVWNNIPQLKHIAESELLNELSKTALKNVQQEVDKILQPIKLLAEAVPGIFEKIPAELKRNIQAEFDETRLTLEKQLKTILKFAPKPTEIINSIQIAFDQVSQANKTRLEEIEQDLARRFKDTLEKMGFPEPEQMRLLTKLIPLTLPLLEELVRFEKIPAEKGKQGELELFQELHDYYPEDEYEHLGSSGEVDIVAVPRLNGTYVGQKVLIESKKNRAGWSRGYLRQLRRHMQSMGERFAILAVEVMPKSANGFLFEHCPEGVILVTDRRYFQVSYGAMRAALMATSIFHSRNLDFSKLFAEKGISETIEEAKRYCEWIRRIREKTHRIANHAKGICDDVDELDNHLKLTLRKLQTKIDDAVAETKPTETKSKSPST